MATPLKSILRSFGIEAAAPDENPPNAATLLAALRAIAPVAEHGAFAFRHPGGGTAGFVQFIPHNPRLIEIHRLWTLSPGQGNGKYMLKILCDLADEHRVEIKLKVLPIGRKPYPMSREDLRAWYRKFGFEGEKWRLLRKPVRNAAAVTAGRV
jgi:hypothetical protein